MQRRVALAAVIAVMFGCATSDSTSSGELRETTVSAPEATSLLGASLQSPELPPAVRQRYEDRLTEATSMLERHPQSITAAVWVGRRTAYLGRYRDAIAVYSRAIADHPEDPRLYRHRGHRYITVRELDSAITDLELAARLIKDHPDEIEPEGLPNARNVPTSTLHTNIWFHLGLAYYLHGEFARALDAFRNCLAESHNPDTIVATSNWMYMTLRRMGDDAAAARVLEPIKADMNVIENANYHRLLLMYKGRMSPESLLAGTDSMGPVDDATIGYGVGNWYLYNGRRADAIAVFRQVVDGSAWPAFGHIAAEAELARIARGERTP
jgi:tetratricopeptide (TPR) repeat protein